MSERTKMEESEEAIPIWWPLIPVPEQQTDDPMSFERLLYCPTSTHHNDEYEGHKIATLATFIISFILNFMLSSLFVIFEGVRNVSSNHFIAALAVSNVLISIHFTIFNVILEPLNGPNALCDFAVYGGVIVCASSNMSRVAIAIDRYIFISDPLRYYQRTQTTCRAFSIGGVFVTCVALIVTPYVFILHHDMSQTCLPAYPKVYVASVVFLLTVIPSVLLVVIYTRIFYWAFVQMQILRQEAKHFLRKRETWDARDDQSSPPSSFTSKQMRVYTGAAILLTPTSPFSSHRHSFDPASMAETEASNMQTTIHKIIHILSGMKDRQRPSITSTSVDNAITNFNRIIFQQYPDKNAITNTNNKCPTMLGGIHSSTPVNGFDAASEIVNARQPSDTSTVESTFSRSSLNIGRSTAVDKMLGSRYTQEFGALRGTPSSYTTSRNYVPVTAQGKWVESQILKYDASVVRTSVDSERQDVGQSLMCKLLKAEIKAGMMIMALMGSFIICWTPFVVIEMVSIFELGEITELERRVAILLIVINCALDPFTYALMNPPFRAVVTRSYHTFCRHYRQPYNLPSQTSINRKYTARSNRSKDTDKSTSRDYLHKHGEHAKHHHDHQGKKTHQTSL